MNNLIEKDSFLVFAKVQATESKGKHFGADTVGGTCNDSRYPCGEKKKRRGKSLKNAHNICPHGRILHSNDIETMFFRVQLKYLTV